MGKKKKKFNGKTTPEKVMNIIGEKNYRELVNSGYMVMSREWSMKRYRRMQDMKKTIVSLSTLISQWGAGRPHRSHTHEDKL